MGVVITIGAYTAKGQVVRVMLFPSAIRDVFGDQVQRFIIIYYNFVIICYNFIRNMHVPGSRACPAMHSIHEASGATGETITSLSPQKL